MADKYSNFDDLDRHETAGVDFRILARRARAAFAVIAPHGGGIEPGTSELAEAVAGLDFSFYGFEGLKSSGNSDLHITSTRFDEPMCLTVVPRSGVVIALHGENSDENGAVVFMGGLDEELGGRLGAELGAQGFEVRRHSDPRLQGRDPQNICNRGACGKGVQLELSRAVREQMFVSLSRDGRKHPTMRFFEFVEAMQGVLSGEVRPSSTLTEGSPPW